MKKLLWVSNIVPSYNEELFVNLAERLPQHGFEFHLLSGLEKRPTQGRQGMMRKVIKNEHKVSLREWHVGTYCVRHMSGVVDYVEKLRPDVVICASQPGNLTTWSLMRYKRRLAYRLVAWQCGYEYHPGKLKNVLLSRYVPRFDHHLAYHNNAAGYARSHGARHDQVTVVHNTLNEQKIALMSQDEARKRVVERHPGIGDRQIVLYVGAILEEKNLDAVANALALLTPHDCVFLIVGDGPYLPVLRARYEHRQDIVFAGRVVDGVGAFFDAADVFILPGTGGLALNEAMAHSLPLISGYADGSADDLVVPGLNGVRLRTSSAEEIAGAIKNILADGNLRRRMGAASRELLLQRFSFDGFLKRICDAVVSVAKNAIVLP